MPKRVRKSSQNQCDQSENPESYGKKRWRPWRPREATFEEEFSSDTDDEYYPQRRKYYGEPVPYIIQSDSAKADIIPLFDPEKNDMESTQWLNKIEQLATIHHWSDRKKSYFMQSRLSGMAKVWHSSLQNYDLTWQQWKEHLLEAFPQKTDFVELLRDMLNKRKSLTENMTQYFYNKLAMLNRLEISGVKAVACIIDGLPPHMKAPARAGNYATPSELFSKFLSVMTDFRPRHAQITTSRPSEDVGGGGNTKTQDAKRNLTCFLCHEIGHSVRRCPKNSFGSRPTCTHCGKSGHLSEKCYFKPSTSAAASTPAKETVNMISEVNQ